MTQKVFFVHEAGFKITVLTRPSPLDGTANTSQPAEKFTHQPDLLINMPEKMKSYLQQWQEVPAGSF